jgi:hypothetical protein
MTPQERLKLEEDLMVASLAGNVAGHMKQVSSMSSVGSNPSKAGVIDPRKFLPKNIPAGAGRSPAPVQGQQVISGAAPALTDDALKPRLNIIPLPEGVTAEEIVAPFRPNAPKIEHPTMTHAGNEIHHAAPAPKKDDPQLELEFDKQATLNDIYSRIDELKSTINTLVYTVEELSKHVTESGKKKSRARELPPTPAVGESN